MLTKGRMDGISTVRLGNSERDGELHDSAAARARRGRVCGYKWSPSIDDGTRCTDRENVK